MFVRDFIHVDQPFEVVAPRFVSDTDWLAPIVEEAAVVARDVAVSLLGHSPAGPAQPGRVRCELGPVRARKSSILVPMWLISERAEAALPDLAGDLEIAPVGAHRSLVAFAATYQRPTHDLDLLERVERATEAGVRTFLNGIAAVLSRPVSPV
ncbi:MAG: hypothetical protein WDA60_17150 [Acidimicrobiia bacterium]|jgi:hypothetical protein